MRRRNASTSRYNLGKSASAGAGISNQSGPAVLCLSYNRDQVGRIAYNFCLHTSFFSFFVRGFPDFVSSGGGIGGAGPERKAVDFSRRSISGSQIEDGLRKCFDLLSEGPLRK